MTTHTDTTRAAVAGTSEADLETPARVPTPAVRPHSEALDLTDATSPERDRRRDPWPPKQDDAQPAQGPAQFRLDFCEPLSPEELDVAAESGFSDPLDFALDSAGRFTQVTLSVEH